MFSPAASFHEAPEQPRMASPVDIGSLSITGQVNEPPPPPLHGGFSRTHQLYDVMPQPAAWFVDPLQASQNPFLAHRLFPEPSNHGGNAGFKIHGGVHHIPTVGLPKDHTFFNSATTQQGSIEIQKALKSNDSIQLTMIHLKALPFTVPLMMDEHGCHVFMKLLDSCSHTQLRLILAVIIDNVSSFLELSSNRSGSKSLKRLIKRLHKSPLLAVMASIIANEFYPLMVHQIGSHVIMECIDTLHHQQNELLYLKAMQHCLELATDERGCISLNSLINHSKGPYRTRLLSCISSHAVYLSQDPWGNYVVQNVLALEDPWWSREICSRLRGHYARLSMMKGGSHVVEKCLRFGEMVRDVVEELLQGNQLVLVAKDKFGNYVVQRMLRVAKERDVELHKEMVKVLKKQKGVLQYGYGKNVWNAIESEEE